MWVLEFAFAIRRRGVRSLRSPIAAALLVVPLALISVACGDRDPSDQGEQQESAAPAIVPTAALLDLVEGEDPGRDGLIARMGALRAPLAREDAEALLRAMKDKSQQAFITVPTADRLGYRVEESPYGGPDLRCEVRWTAIATLERLGCVEALPDLISALHDRHPVVRHQAARALWTFGSDAGLPVLLKGLEGRAFSNESAALMLREITGREFGFDTDGGWARKSEAIAAWATFLDGDELKRPTLPAAGDDPHLDRRVRFLVDVLGQHQFLFMEQSRRALASLGDLAVVHVEAALEEGANDQLRAYAVQSLEKIGTARARGVLEGLLAQDEDGAVRLRAAQALGAIDDPASVEVLKAALSDRDEGVVATAALALGHMGPKASASAEDLKAVLNRASAAPRARWTAAIGLSRTQGGDAAAASFIVDLMKSAPPLRRTEIAADLADWKSDLLGWRAKVDAAEQAEVIDRWARVLRQGE